MIVPDNPSLSIIIPVYNVEKYLPMCLDSLLKTEGIEETEIIMIDDGSTDRSGEIAEDYARDYQNIRAIHKGNEGPSASRNLGLRAASGTYVFFCDSDDEVVPEKFKRIIELSKESSYDLILWDSALIYDKDDPIDRKRREGYFAHYGLDREERTYTGKQLISTLLKNSGNFVATVWISAYRRTYLIENELFFENGLIHEDELWVPKVYLRAGSIRYIPERIYHYRIHPGSIMNPVTGDRAQSVKSLMHVYPSLYEFYDETLAGDPLKDLIEENLTKRYLHMIYKYRICKYGYGKQIDKKLLLRTSRRLREKIMALGLYIFAH